MEERLVSVVIVGARGRMGQTLIREVLDSEHLTLVGAVERPGSPGIGSDAGAMVGMPTVGVPVSDELRPPRNCVVVDFSLPEATARTLSSTLNESSSALHRWSRYSVTSSPRFNSPRVTMLSPINALSSVDLPEPFAPCSANLTLPRQLKSR